MLLAKHYGKETQGFYMTNRTNKLSCVERMGRKGQLDWALWAIHLHSYEWRIFAFHWVQKFGFGELWPESLQRRKTLDLERIWTSWTGTLCENQTWGKLSFLWFCISINMKESKLQLRRHFDGLLFCQKN